MRFRFLELFILACATAPSVAVSQSISGAMLGNTCAGCHGTLGVSENARIPPLAGVDATQFITTMQAYRDGSQRGTIMNRIARAYSDEEINAMAEYFANLPKQVNE